MRHIDVQTSPALFVFCAFVLILGCGAMVYKCVKLYRYRRSPSAPEIQAGEILAWILCLVMLVVSVSLFVWLSMLFFR